MSNRFVVEVGDSIVGIAVHSGDGFKFFASDPAFLPLEGRSFAGPYAVERAARAHRERIEEKPAQ